MNIVQNKKQHDTYYPLPPPISPAFLSLPASVLSGPAFVRRVAGLSLLHGKGDNQEEEREEEKTRRRTKRLEDAPVVPPSRVASPQAFVTLVIFLCLGIFQSCKQ